MLIKFFSKVEGCFTLHLAKFRDNLPSSSRDKKIEMIVIWRFRSNTPQYYGKITRRDRGKGGKYGYVFLQLSWMKFFMDSNTNKNFCFLYGPLLVTHKTRH